MGKIGDRSASAEWLWSCRLAEIVVVVGVVAEGWLLAAWNACTLAIWPSGHPAPSPARNPLFCEIDKLARDIDTGTFGVSAAGRICERRQISRAQLAASVKHGR
jgi:hypothetical protein